MNQRPVWQLFLLTRVFSLLGTQSFEEGVGASLSASEVEIDATGAVKETDEEATAQLSLNSTVNDNDDDDGVPSHLKECTIWLAPSAIEGAGLGLFAGRDFRRHAKLQPMGDVVIPIVDKLLHNQVPELEDFLWDEYTWKGWVVGTDAEAYDAGDGASPGFGSTANSFLGLVNVKEGSPKRDNESLHRSKDPGAGAFTAYYDRVSTATRLIKRGEEFYVDYGDHWFTSRTSLGPVPLYDDLDEATELFFEFRELEKTGAAPSVLEDLWDTFLRHTSFNESRVIGSFHHDDADELALLEEYESLKELRQDQATRSPEWLYQHGTCGDHIHGNTSTLAQAGRGGFASRDLPNGTVVAQLPLIHITNRSQLNMYHFDEERKQNLGPRPPQLLLNYCYGHPESTLVLCPYGPMVNFVNHNQSQANVKIVWADPAKGNQQPELLERSLEALEEDATAKLAFEFIATRPIYKGEEIFLDYQNSWEESWQAHVASWTPVENASEYMPFDNFKTEIAGKPFRTSVELIDNPYPLNVETECSGYFYEVRKSDWVTFKKKLKVEMDEHGWIPCTITARPSPETYSAMYKLRTASTTLTDLPTLAVRFVEKPYTSDMFLENAFRHEIGIADEIFPDAWRNLSPRNMAPPKR